MLRNIKTFFSTRSYRPPSGLMPAGIYHYQRQENGGQMRLHLRVEKDGRGLLLANAARAFHLNPTAAYMAYIYLEGIPEHQAVASLTRHFHVSKHQAAQDYANFITQLSEITHPDGACPVCDLELETLAPFSDRPSAPYRMDLALTYRCNNDCAHCYNARPRQGTELNTGDWKKILDQLWQIGIPHIVFTGGEPTLRSDLPELVAYAEQLGQITGINTNGRRLKDLDYVSKLVQAGLDHVQVTLESHDPHIHDGMVFREGAWEETVAGLRNALDTKLFIMTNTTLLQENSPYLAQTLEFLAGLGVPTVGLNALIYSGNGLTVGKGLPESSLPPLVEMARKLTESYNQRLIWYTPTQYCHFDPLQLELGVKGCTAALYNMCVEPDGSVIPCQSFYQTLGYMQRDPWESIWNHELAVSLRTRHNVPDACRDCALLAECGGGCPLARQVLPAFQPQPIHPLEIAHKEG